jgi:hypothetical protein
MFVLLIWFEDSLSLDTGMARFFGYGAASTNPRNGGGERVEWTRKREQALGPDRLYSFK